MSTMVTVLFATPIGLLAFCMLIKRLKSKKVSENIETNFQPNGYREYTGSSADQEQYPC